MSSMHRCRPTGIIIMLLFAWLTLSSGPAAATNELDVAVGLKTLPLLYNKLGNNVVVAVIYNPKLAESKTQADSIKAAIDGGMEAPGEIKLSAIMVSTEDLSKLGDAKIGVVTTGACTEELATAASSRGILTMSSDLDCVRANRCILGLVSRPSVEIYFSKSAADAAKVDFARSFIMVVKRV